MNTATRNARTGLWEKAKDLPVARDSDFFGANRRPPGVDADLLKIINDTALRTRLIDSGIAEGLQSPKGPQKIPSIVPAVRGAIGLPTVEELDMLLARIHAVESEVSETLAHQLNADIARLKREIGDLDGDEFEHAFLQLYRALGARKALAGQVREEAFKRVDADAAFAPRKFLRLISRAPKG